MPSYTAHPPLSFADMLQVRQGCVPIVAWTRGDQNLTGVGEGGFRYS